jgi:hypothetical protein
MQGMPSNYGPNLNLHHNGWYSGVSVRNVDDGYSKQGYYRFNLSGIPPSSIEQAILRLYHPRTPTGSLTISSLTDGSWTEKGINWNNAPIAISLLGTKTILSGWNEFDVTEFIKTQTDDKVSFCLNISPDTQSYFISREGRTDWRPHIVIRHTSDVRLPQEEDYWAKTTSKLPRDSIWLVHNGSWTQYTSALDTINKATPGQAKINYKCKWCD